MAIERGIVIAKMRKAFREGLSVSRFISEMKEAGLTYRRTDMLSDWRSVSKVEKAEGLLKYVRKDRYPTGVQIPKAWPKMSTEYMYKVRVQSRLRPDEPIHDTFVNVPSDKPLTPREIEAQIEESYGLTESLPPEILEGITAWTAIHKVME